MQYSISYSQNDYLNMQKYWYYRNRLKYFIVPGSSEGESQIAGIRNNWKKGMTTISWGQHGVHFGYYLGVLATEYYLLNVFNQDYSETLEELSLALNAYVEQMDKCEQKYYNLPDNFDGFFVRDNVTCDINYMSQHLEQINNNLTINDTWDHFRDGRPGWVDCVLGCENCPNDGQINIPAVPMGQDEAIGLLKGLSLVYRCLPENSYQKTLSQEIALKIITKMWNYGLWVVVKPDGSVVSSNDGGIITTYAYSLSKCAEYFGQNHLCFWSTTDVSTYQLRRLSWEAMQYCGWGASNNSMTATLAAVCDCWTAENSNPITGFLLNTTDEGIYLIGGLDDWDPFYMMQWEILHNSRSPYLDKAKAQLMITQAPCEGPYCWSLGDNRALSGWASSYRFEKDVEHQNNGEGAGFEGVYHGLDYMLLYNLYYITELRDWTDGVRNGKILPPYININNMTSSNIAFPYQNFTNPLNPGLIVGNNSMPHNDYGFSTISSSAIIDNICHRIYPPNGNTNNIITYSGNNCFGNVTYRAGEKINLMPGFAVKPGAYFHGYIEPFHCNCTEYTSTVNNYDYGIEGDYDKEVSEYYYGRYHDDFRPGIDAGERIDSVMKENIVAYKIFPNPFTEKFTLEYSINEGVEINISIVSETGVIQKELIIKQTAPGSFSETINCSDIAAGVYNCVIKTEGYSRSVKILKTR
jgi:hypothetical protein